MRFCYLRIPLLAGILAATASANSTSTSTKLAALREERSRLSNRNDFAAMGASVSDEDRVVTFRAEEMSIRRFIEDVLLLRFPKQKRLLDGFSQVYNNMVKEQVSPQTDYKNVLKEVGDEPLLESAPWKRWAFFVSKYAFQEYGDPHEYIVAIMLEHHGASQFSEILDAAEPTMKSLVNKLQDAQISLWAKLNYTPQTVFNLLHLEKLWDKNIFASRQFNTWTRYLEHVPNAKYVDEPVGNEVHSLCEFVGYDRLLRLLMSMGKDPGPKGVQYLEVLKSIKLNMGEFPVSIVSILLEGTQDSESQFTLLFIYEPTKKFWMTYAQAFFKRYPYIETSLCKALTAIFDVPTLLTMLHAAAIAPDKERSDMALWYLTLQFSEWKKTWATDVSYLMSDSTNLTYENWPANYAIWQAYFQFCKHGTRPTKEALLM